MTEKKTKKPTLREQIQKLMEEVNQLKNDKLYLRADMDNQRKNYDKRIEEINKYRYESFAYDLLDIVDDFEREIKITNNESPIYAKLVNLLNKYKIKKIYESPHDIYNPDYDNVITYVPVTDVNEDNKIVDIFKPGYMYGDKVLRYEDVVAGRYSGETNEE